VQPARYDVIIVGSSPLLMLAAIRWRRAGKTVLVIEAAEALGGAWKIDECRIGARQLRHECACHLIEWYAGGYRLLQNLSSYPFVPLQPQPVKVWSNGRVENYMSKSGIIREYARSLRSAGMLLAKLLLGPVLRNRRPVRGRWRAWRESIRRIVFAARYRLPGIVGFDALQGPAGGFAEFIHHIQGELRRQGVVIARRRATAIVREGADCIVLCDDGSRFRCEQPVVGESTDLERGADGGRRANHVKDYHHVLISFPSSQVVVRNTYVHLADHPLLHRITFVHDVDLSQSEQISLFLVQLRQPYEQIGNLAGELNEVFELYRIATSVAELKVWKVIREQYVASSTESSWQEYGADEPVLIRTIGDLARRVISMNRQLRFPRSSDGEYQWTR
jgi:hypothetical protein